MKKLEAESYLLVIVQFLCAVFFFYMVGAAPLMLFPIILITISFAIALWAIFTMHFGNFTINPIPKQDAVLVTSGVYRFLRHPMYAAVLLGMLAVAINIHSWLGYGVWIILLIDLIVKLRFEEKLLTEKFPGYAEYRKQTKRLLPWIW